ncbi:bifunctional diguanylate cyclase/phosphodiesterase [Lutibacter sp. B2]|nr:bifunctional diguanylate cyclase/phosphodiesterase [Lutibacter sp. B2]
MKKYKLTYILYFINISILILTLVFDRYKIDGLIISIIITTIGIAVISKEKKECYKDSITGVYNKLFLMDKINGELKNENNTFVVVLFDVERFSEIYESLDGNQFLKIIANKLIKSVKDKGVVGRITRAQYLILLNQIENIEDAKEIVQNIMNEFKEPIIIDGSKLNLSVNMGMSVYPNDGDHLNSLYNKASIAIHKATESNGSKLEFYSYELNEKIKKEFILENKLQDALEKEELLLNYQPIIDIDTKKIIGCEALLRWINDELGMIPPDRFIPIAEKNNLIIKIGEWVIRTACKQNKKWQDEGMDPIFIAVNISVIQLKQEEFVKLVDNILKETGLDPKYLELEITESISKDNMEEIIVILKNLKNLGVSISMDDFGTGYSSLSQLKDLSLNTLKIDKSFIDDIDNNENDISIISAIIAMAKKLGLNIVAEGVETTNQFKFLDDNKCDMVQGYLFSKPLNKTEFEKLINE